ncbi:UNVERIFIED_CONTAM: hypothetical protein RMT77_014643 [Armadillidium vulgare]
MPYKCQALFCENNYKKYSNISYFNFPKKEEDFKRWVNACCKSSVLELYDTDLQKVKKRIRLCENHFYEKDIIRSGRRNFLKEGAIPREVVVLKIKKKLVPKKNNFDHSNPIYVTVQDYENSEKEFCKIILDKIPETNNNTQDKSGEIIISLLSEDSLVSNENVLIEISDGKIPIISFPIEESSIQNIDERLNNQPKVQEATMTSMREDTGNHQQDGEIRKSGDSNGPPCSHYIGLIEQKAENYQLQRKIERMADDIRTLKEQLFNLEEEVKKRGVNEDVLLIKEEEIELEETAGIKLEDFDDFDEIT